MIRKTCLLATAAFGIAMLSAPALAQEQVDELVVTGSRISRPNLEQPTPVATVDARALRNAGVTGLGDVLAELPALSSSGTVRAHSDLGENLGGLSFADLRGLGSARTLTLVNGKRHVSGDAGSTAVDLNTIPMALIDRVEVITGGASAIYGSDAVSGVVNVILKDDFEGYDLGMQVGSPADGSYGQQFSVDATGGGNFAGGRGNVTLTGFYDQQKSVNGRQIQGRAEWGAILNPEDPTQDLSNGIPNRLWRPWVMGDLAGPNGVVVDPTFTSWTSFDASGSPVAMPPRTGTNDATYGSFAERCDLCTSQDANTFPVPEMERMGLATTVRYDLPAGLTFRGDVKYVVTETLDTLFPSFNDPLQSPLVYAGAGHPANNAFITPALTAVLDEGFATTGMPFVVISRLNADIGGRNADTTRKTFRAVAALEGVVDAGLAEVDWELSYNFGRTRNLFEMENGLIPGNYHSAIDAVVNPFTGDLQCRRDVPALYYPGYVSPGPVTDETCVPFNPFGQQNGQDAIDYVTFEATRKHAITQQVASLVGRFDSARFLNLQGGPLAFAGGLEWRREESRNLNDPLILSGVTEAAPQPNAFGGFEVKEAFAEVEAPILAGLPFAHRLNLTGAVRLADYSHAGEAASWKLGAVWAPAPGLALRATYSVAVRAPNITEAFLPPTAGFFQMSDPCQTATRNDDPDRADNCDALSAPNAPAIETSYPGVASGNTGLESEEANTWTAGLAYRPAWAPGLSVTIDYYDLRIEDAITLLAPQDAADRCVDGPQLASQYCGLIVRDPGGEIVSVRSLYLNQAALETSGWDVQVAYSRVLGVVPGQVTASLSANILEDLREYAFADFPDEADIEEGEVGDPELSFVSGLTYEAGPWGLTWESRYIDRVRRDRDLPLEYTDRPYVEANWYHDFIGRYRFEGQSRGEVYAGVNNAFGETVPLGLTGAGNSAGYDIFGRYLFAGVRVGF